MERPIEITILNNNVELDELCYCTNNVHMEPDEDCDNCEGTGLVPTEEGEAILKLVNRYLNVECR